MNVYKILFRGKSKSLNKWLYGDIISDFDNDKFYIAERSSDKIFYYDCNVTSGIGCKLDEYYSEVYKESVGMFTGIYDNITKYEELSKEEKEYYQSLPDSTCIGKLIFDGDYIDKYNKVEFSFGCWNINGDRPLYHYKNIQVVDNWFDRNFNKE